ncbi:MAG: threonylcarbamoyl-AMP synthase [Cryomorphaceae bacterium]|nr:threonylcarbamoyl-AMP synthase [Cryomorphaceae bacterium]
MKTELLSCNDDLSGSIERAAALIRLGEVVAIPTETVYGLGADGLNPSATGKIYTAKGRPSDNPLILHISDRAQLEMIAETNHPMLEALMSAFWPGSLTLVLPKKEVVPPTSTGGLDTVAVRMPNHKIALEIIRKAGVPIAAPSANTSGKPSPTNAQHVAEDLTGRIAAIVNAGPCTIGVESTVLDLTQEKPAILRPGAVTRDQIESVIGALGSATADISKHSPGTRYRHYCPNAEVIIINEPCDFDTAVLEMKKVAWIGSHPPQGAKKVFKLTTAEDYAREIFNALRICDSEGIEIIVVEEISDAGLGAAVMDRLRRAAGKS